MSAAPSIERAPKALRHRLFFALWPAREVALQLDTLSAALPVRGEQARKIRPDALHITLAFLGDVAPERLPALIDMAALLPCPNFTLELDRIACWRRGGIVWAGSHARHEALAAFVATLNQGLKGLGFDIDTREFVPHVTLFRRASLVGERAVAPPLQWPVRGFRLVDSTPQAGYVPLWRNEPDSPPELAIRNGGARPPEFEAGEE